ncbi:MAG: amidohydrolase family protein [Planctomycetaceae bacterium]
MVRDRFRVFVILLLGLVVDRDVGDTRAAELGEAERTLVIKNVSLFDSMAGAMRPSRTIVIRGARILDVVGADAAVTVPEGARVLDGTGKYAIPGLIDAHVHLVHLADRMHITGDEFLPMFIAAGVTSVRSAGDAIVAESSVAKFAESHPERSPRVFLASPLIDRDPPFHRDVGYALTDPAKVQAFVEDMVAWRVTTLKIYVGTPRAVGVEVIKEGQKRGLKITGHLGAYSAQEAAADGIDCLEHIWSVFNYSIPPEAAKQPDHRANLDLNNPQCQALVELLANRKVTVDPTLVVFRNMIYLNDLEEVHKHPDLQHVPKRMLQYWESYRAGSGLKPDTRDARQKEIQKYQELTGKLHRFGVPILVGTDTPEPFVPPGFSLHQELEMLVQSGLTAAEALTSATLLNARMVNKGDELGHLDKGKIADLVILSADPTVDIRNTRKIENVIRSGHVTTPAAALAFVPAD